MGEPSRQRVGVRSPCLVKRHRSTGKRGHTDVSDGGAFGQRGSGYLSAAHAGANA